MLYCTPNFPSRNTLIPDLRTLDASPDNCDKDQPSKALMSCKSSHNSLRDLKHIIIKRTFAINLIRVMKLEDADVDRNISETLFKNGCQLEELFVI